MPLEASKRATYQDLLALPDSVLGQIIDGELVVSPRPGVEHARSASMLGGDLVGAFDRGRGGPGGWWILFEPELHLDDHVLVPDLAGWRRARVLQLPPGPHLGIAPDWVCEVLSPSTASLDRIRKVRVYAHYEVSHAWLVDPAAQTLEVFRRQETSWLLVAAHAGNEIVRAEPFEAVEIDLDSLWLTPAPVPSPG